jgi:hypothetical protein
VKVFVGCRGTGKVPARIGWDRPRGANSVFLNRSPSRRRNSQTALTLTPRAASSSFRACNVRCGVWPSRSMMNARCGASTGLRYPPNSPGATEPVAAELLSDRDRSGRRSNGEARAHGAHQDRAAGVGPGADGSQCECFEDASGRKLHAVPALEVSAAFWPFSKLVRWAKTTYSDRGALRSGRS